MAQVSVSLGNFLFKHRNWVFPVFIAAIFTVGIPPSQTFGSEALEHVKDAVAIALALAGLTVRGLVIGHRYVRRSGENKTIHASDLFTTGMFALCRNPLYLGNVLILFGIFLMHGNPYVIVIGTICFTIIYQSLILAEENYLRGRFGEDYGRYCILVPRWVPDVLKVATAMRSLPFSLGRVVAVEYTNIGITVGALSLIELYEEIEEPLTSARSHYIAVLMGIVVVAVLWLSAMRILKKRGIIVTS